jgi:miniconductance mechanosensitive channel
LDLQSFLYDYLIDAGLSSDTARAINMTGLLVGSLIVVLLIDVVSRLLIRQFFSRLASVTKTHFDDLLVNNQVPRNLAHVPSLLVAHELIPYVFVSYSYWESFAENTLQIIGIVVVLWIVRGILRTIRDYLKLLPNFKDKPIDSYIQVVMIVAWIVGILSAFAIVTGIAFLEFVTTLGAASAVILLIFKDSILGFVASIQVTINDMVRIGDWVTFEKFGADGDVVEINLSTVKVQNFDKTITTIPTYALISDSFKNWRGMQESDGRRIKRSVNLKLSSIKYLDQNDIDKLKGISLISDYLDHRQSDIEKFNTDRDIDKTLAINGRNLTNIGVFRKYIQSYIEQHSGVNKDMMIMVRQLSPTPYGLPLEIYAFSADKRWMNYEFIMADIFDHVTAAVPFFDLEVFELPTGAQGGDVSGVYSTND